MLSTIGEFVWLPYILTGLAFSILCVWWYSLYSARRIRTEFPTKTNLNTIRAEIDSLSGDLADLSARFSRFQKRENMTAAREAKRSNASLLQEASEIVGQSGSKNSETSAKADLYAKIRSH